MPNVLEHAWHDVTESSEIHKGDVLSRNTKELSSLREGCGFDRFAVRCGVVVFGSIELTDTFVPTELTDNEGSRE